MIATFTLERARRAVLEKCSLADETEIVLSYVTADGSHVDLEDDEDVRAFRVHASREPVITVHAKMPDHASACYLRRTH